MKRKIILYTLLVIPVFYLSCKKDIDQKWVGTYKGTARHMMGNAINPIRDRDTLYTDVLITVSEGTESTRKETRLTLTIVPSTINTVYRENMTVNNGVINFTRTNRGSVGSYYKWLGSINSDSLNLINRNEEGNGTVWQWEMKAIKQ